MPRGIYVRTKESNEKRSKTLLGHPVAEETRSNIAKAKIGIPRPKKVRKQISKTLTGRYKGEDSPHYGKHPSKKTRELMRLAKIGKYIKENNPNWKGGKSFEDYPIEWSTLLKESIRERDHYTCQKCFTTDNKGQAFIVHHIDYNKKNCDPSNLIALCRSCNAKVNFNREHWTKYFVKKIFCLDTGHRTNNPSQIQKTPSERS